MLNKIFLWVSVVFYVLLLSACGNGSGLTVATVQGNCPSGGVGNGPYCMAVQITNNGGGQNWITNSSFPISNLSAVVSGATNVQGPSTNQSTMDPNNCTTSTLSPGSTCTFYLKINNEVYSTLATETINVNLNYTVNNTLFGGSDSTSTNSFVVYEVTNLYAAQSNGYLAVANTTGLNNYFVESYGDIIYSAATDTSAYGFVYLGGGLGIYQVGNESGNESGSSSIAPSYINAVYNLFPISSSIYATSGGSVWSYSLSGESWSANAIYSLGGTIIANVLSPSGTLYLAESTQVFSCTSSNTSTTSNCNSEGLSTGSSNTGNIIALGFPNSGIAPYTGLYIGAAQGLYVESGTLGQSTNPWINITNSANNTSITNQINTMVSYNNNLFAGDNKGNIWFVAESSPITATLLGTVDGAINTMVVDSVGGIIYFAVNNANTSTTYSVYACTVTANTCSPTLLFTVPNMIVSLNIASQLLNSL